MRQETSTFTFPRPPCWRLRRPSKVLRIPIRRCSVTGPVGTGPSTKKLLMIPLSVQCSFIYTPTSGTSSFPLDTSTFDTLDWISLSLWYTYLTMSITSSTTNPSSSHSPTSPASVPSLNPSPVLSQSLITSTYPGTAPDMLANTATASPEPVSGDSPNTLRQEYMESMIEPPRRHYPTDSGRSSLDTHPGPIFSPSRKSFREPHKGNYRLTDRINERSLHHGGCPYALLVRRDF